jgi:hypothetical protein
LCEYNRARISREVKWIERNAAKRFTNERLEKMIGDKAYDYVPLNKQLTQLDIEVDCAE